ncbi:protein ZINC INDUCED FACILITATOR-LIKE 1-like [Pyrus ussuriensis x Pyrus communis]|uniref:Protein ZINC INDUCED FACILITATOR-LIKE 1-like n=1 Tax=Pyrus ussuriensis x Pyrus communis TaxID=2448454 RepID=A0A5N5GAR7_9ROSA|nr:protein ZINC INDUCED FACILITATOR-LIKE 1-like [Pyrus ussuriensis x Pyrus communis]
MEANLILFQRSLRRQAHFAPKLFNDKVDSAPHRRTPRLPLAVAHLALPRHCTPYQNSNQCLILIFFLFAGQKTTREGRDYQECKTQTGEDKQGRRYQGCRSLIKGGRADPVI